MSRGFLYNARSPLRAKIFWQARKHARPNYTRFGLSFRCFAENIDYVFRLRVNVDGQVQIKVVVERVERLEAARTSQEPVKAGC